MGRFLGAGRRMGSVAGSRAWATRRRALPGVEPLEGRRLMAQAVQPVASLPAASSNMIAGPDASLWAAVNPTSTTAAIDRIGLDGSVTSFPLPGSAAGGIHVISLADGPDGKVWFVANVDSSVTDTRVVVGNMTAAGQVAELSPIAPPAGQIAAADQIIAGPGGDLWFNYSAFTFTQPRTSNSFIVRVTTAGVITEYPLPILGPRVPPVMSLANGPEGDLWFTLEGRANVVDRMTPAGNITQFPISKLAAWSVWSGPDGSLIATGATRGLHTRVVSISGNGTVTRLKVPARISGRFLIYQGSTTDGSLWFSGGAAALGRIRLGGAARTYRLAISTRNHIVISAAVGADGNLYMLDAFLGRHMPPSATVYRLAVDRLPPVAARGSGS